MSPPARRSSRRRHHPQSKVYRLLWDELNKLSETVIIALDEIDYTDPLISTVMDEARGFIVNETDRDEDITEKADTALVGLAAQVLDTEQADRVVLLTTDKPAGRVAETLLPQHGFSDRIEFRYVSVQFLETITANEFQ